MDTLAVIADDLTGACDVGAALTPWPGGVTVCSVDEPTSARTAAPGLLVVNTQSRTLPPAAAAARVTRALAAQRPSLLLKKIDTGLRGALGAELDAAIDAVGAAGAFVMPAIPEAGRTTIAGRQLIDGVPVHETAFGRDPQNPVRESAIAVVLEATSRRRTAVVELAQVRRPDDLAAVVGRQTASLVVCDAVSDRDLETAVRVVLGRPRPLVVAGSTGLARALRGALLAEAGPAADRGRDPDPGGRGVLVVAGSDHPVARAQVAGVMEHGGRVFVADGAGVARRARRVVADGGIAVLAAPGGTVPGGSGAILAALAAAAQEVLREARPRVLALVGGETGHAVLGAVGHPRLRVADRVAALAVRSVVADGPFAGLVVVTKGGSSGARDLLATLVREIGGTR